MIRTHLDFVEDHLSKNTWFLVDDLSAADIQMIFPLEDTGYRRQEPAQHYRLGPAGLPEGTRERWEV